MVQRIVAVIQPKACDHMVEIGPGLGVLTQELVPLVKRLDAVELDRDLVARLPAQMLPLGNFTIHSADALKFDFCSLQQEQEKLRIVGNLPYNISTPLMFKLIEQSACIKDMHFMLQKEVVDRLAAQPGSGAYGKLSVVMQYHCKVHKSLFVPPECFSPPPKVDSAVVSLIPHVKPPVELLSEQSFIALVTAAFAQRRKTLKNNLKTLLSAEQIQSLGIDPQRRAETLSLEEYALLANAAAS